MHFIEIAKKVDVTFCLQSLGEGQWKVLTWISSQSSLFWIFGFSIRSHFSMTRLACAQKNCGEPM